MMPWQTADITVHVIDNSSIASQEDVNALTKSIYVEKHHKVFAEDWTQKDASQYW